MKHTLFALLVAAVAGLSACSTAPKQCPVTGSCGAQTAATSCCAKKKDCKHKSKCAHKTKCDDKTKCKDKSKCKDKTQCSSKKKQG